MKRLIAGPLWFLAFWFIYELLWSLIGVPRLAGPILGIIVAATVCIDPMHWFWPAPSARSSTSIPFRLFQTSPK